ncbi:MAG: YceI family protein [Pseudomonadota bacterium]
MLRIVILLALFLFTSLPSFAEPQRYRLDPAASKVEFTYTLSGTPATGTMPISQADLILDFGQVSRSSANVTLNAAGTKTGVVFVTQALKSGDVLDTDQHPQISFVSRSMSGSVNGAQITGDLTMKGVTKPLTMDAKIYRRAGTESGDLSQLTVHLTGTLDRREFGADGYSDLVSPDVELFIIARLDRVDG